MTDDEIARAWPTFTRDQRAWARVGYSMGYEAARCCPTGIDGPTDPAERKAWIRAEARAEAMAWATS